MTKLLHGDYHSLPRATKTLGPRAGQLVLTLYERNHSIFQLSEAHAILGGELNTVQQLMFDLVAKGIVTRIKNGLYRLVPFELGFEREYLGNPYVVARELFRARRGKMEGAEGRVDYEPAFDVAKFLKFESGTLSDECFQNIY